jgi:hypothetical protein
MDPNPYKAPREALKARRDTQPQFGVGTTVFLIIAVVLIWITALDLLAFALSLWRDSR